MSGFDPENHTHVMLRDMHARQDKILVYVERIAEDVHDLKVRMTSVETAVVGLQRRVDRMDDRLSHLETRAGLIGTEFRESADTYTGPETP